MIGGPAGVPGREVGSHVACEQVRGKRSAASRYFSDRLPRPIQSSRHEPTHEEINDIETSYSETARSAPGEPSYARTHAYPRGSGFEDSSQRPASSAVAKGIDLYFEYCHRQPIWCFNREDIGDKNGLPNELACSILALTSRFAREREQWQQYRDIAKRSIMLRVANGTVELATIESLCLLSYSSFIGRLSSH